MNNASLRLYIVAAIVLAIMGIGYLVEAGLEPPEVEMPDWTLQSMPLRMNNWRGEETKIDPKIAAATEADAIVNRAYQDDAGRTFLLHTAMFKNPAAGVYHYPLNCYRTAGWRQLNETFEKVAVAEDLSVSVSLSMWEREGEKILVAYWYQLGEHLLYSRRDLGLEIRWAMRGQEKWPALIKIMVQTSLVSEDTKTTTLDFMQLIAKWLNSPEHRKYLDRWPRS